MGLRASKKSQAEQEEQEVVKQLSLIHTKLKLNNLRNSILKEAKESQSIISADDRSLQTQTSLYAIHTALEQLNRNGKTLIKADLIAMVIALKPQYIHMINELQSKFTVPDLNCLIRTLLYDPDVIKQRYHSTTLQATSEPVLQPIKESSNEIDVIL